MACLNRRALISLPLASTSFNCGRTPLDSSRRGAWRRSRRGRNAGHVVGLLGDGDAFLHVLEPSALELGENRTRSRSHSASTWPALTVLPSSTSSLAPYGTLWRSRSRLPSEMTTSADARSRSCRPPRFHVAHGASEFAGTRRRRSQQCLNPRYGCCATDVERTHRELGARLTNRLCCDDTDGFYPR